MVKYKIKDLCNKILLQEKLEISNSIDKKFVWNDIKYIWAKLEYVSVKSSSEKFDTLYIKGTYCFIIRSLNIVNEKMRIIFNNKVYNIRYINQIDKNFTNILCEEE